MSYLRKEVEILSKFEAEIEEGADSKKILFIGLTHSGKTSIIHVVFSGLNPEDTTDIPATINYTRHARSFKDMNIFIYDIGGQISFLEQALGESRELIFSDLNAIFFVIDASNFWEYQESRVYFHMTEQVAREFNEEVQIIVLAHKMDLIPKEEKENVVNQITEILGLDEIVDVEINGTTIYDDSITRAIEKTLQLIE